MYYKKINNTYTKLSAKELERINKMNSNVTEALMNSLGNFLYEAPQLAEYEVKTDEIIAIEGTERVTSGVRDMTIAEKNTYVKQRDFNGKDKKIIASYPWSVRNLTGLATEAQTNPNIDYVVKETESDKIAIVYLNVIDAEVLTILEQFPNEITIETFTPELEIIIE